ncbi:MULTISPECIES: peptidase [Pseudomonas]|uniref:Peptidase n=1 Tax=Pseudomonas cedrina TaxID=651740 RepID=A0A2S9E2D8_PSECE|nr:MULTISPECIES: peptidase [Pseudomonas]AVJ21002.1 peptidase [Pseudomonas sp. MYb193]PRC09001.1 peptidase [Pseudomonas cedrina]
MSPLMMKLLGRVYMSEVDAGGGGGGDVSAPAPTAEAPAPAADSSVLTPPAPTDAQAPKPDDAKPEDADKPKDESKDADGKDKPNGAPEAYEDFTLPEGMEMDVEILGEFKNLAKELNIPQAKAQQLIDFQSQLANKQAEAYQAAVTKQAKDWAAEIKSDPEIGGENYDKSVASAIKVIQSFGDPALTELLNTSGLGNHPALFKFCHRISAAISEDKFVMPGSQTNAPKEMSIIDAFK